MTSREWKRDAMPTPPDDAPIDLDTLLDDRAEDEALAVVTAELRTARERIADLVAALDEAIGMAVSYADSSGAYDDVSEDCARLATIAHPPPSDGTTRSTP